MSITYRTASVAGNSKNKTPKKTHCTIKINRILSISGFFGIYEYEISHGMLHRDGKGEQNSHTHKTTYCSTATAQKMIQA